MRSLAEFPLRIAWLSALAWLVLLLSPVRAEPLATVVRIAEPADGALFERVRGQASDLAVELAALEAGPLEGVRSAQLQRARELGREHSAVVVVWFARDATTLEVLVADLTAERLFARSIELGDDALARSAQEEAAGLIVRSALRASLLGAALGTPQEELAPKPPPPPPSEPPPPAAPPAIVPPPPEEPHLRAALAAIGAFDGATNFGQLRAGARLGIVLGRLELGVLGAFGFASPIDTDLADLRAAQHRAGGYVAFVPELNTRVSAVIEGGAQLALVRTRARATRAGFDAASERAALAAFDLGLGLRVALHRRVGLGFSAGAAAFSRRIVYGYGATGTGAFNRVAPAWPIEPRLAIELWTAF